MTEPLTLDLEAPEDVDPDAPHGRNPRTGQPYKRPKEWREKTSANLRATAGAAKMAAGATKSSATKRQPAGTTDYRPALIGLITVPAMMLTMMGRVNPLFALDGIAIQHHAPTIAGAINEAAMTNEQIAQALDRILAVGPYGALIAAVMPLALQLAANHGLIEPSPEMGIFTPAELMNAAGIPTQRTTTPEPNHADA